MEKEDKKSIKKHNPKHKNTGREMWLEEYRLVPIDEYADYHKRGNEINLLELIKYVWSRRKLILKITGVFLFIGLLIAFLSPIEYKTEATLMPETQNQQGQFNSILQRYGGMLGLSGSSFEMSQTGAISPLLYPKIVNSLPFQLQLLNQSVYFDSYDTTTTVFNFFNNIYRPSIFSYIKKLTIGLPRRIMKFFEGRNQQYDLPFEFNAENIIRLNEEQLEVIETLSDRITVNFDEETGVILISSEMPDPSAAALVGNIAINLLTEYIKEYRTQKATVDLEFVETQYNEAQKRFQKIQLKLADFRDKNLNVTTARAQTELERLQNERDLAFNVYNSLAQQLEQARISVQEQTPVFKTLQPVQLPIEKSWPRRKLILLISIFAGLFFGTIYALFKLFYSQVILDKA